MNFYKMLIITFLLFSFVEASAQVGIGTKKGLYPEIPRISVELAHLKYKTGNIILVDAMNRETFAIEHIIGAINIPISPYENLQRFRESNLPFPKDKEFIIYCN